MLYKTKFLIITIQTKNKYNQNYGTFSNNEKILEKISFITDSSFKTIVLNNEEKNKLLIDYGTEQIKSAQYIFIYDYECMKHLTMLSFIEKQVYYISKHFNNRTIKQIMKTLFDEEVDDCPNSFCNAINLKK